MDEMHEVQANNLKGDVDSLEEITTRLGWVSRRRFEQELGAYHMTVPQFMALRCIENSPEGCNMSELAESSHQVSATMTGIIDRLEDRELVVRARDPRDRRSQRVLITPAGKTLMEQISLRKRQWIEQFLATLSPEERRMMITMARRYLEMIERTVHLAE